MRAGEVDVLKLKRKRKKKFIFTQSLPVYILVVFVVDLLSKTYYKQHGNRKKRVEFCLEIMSSSMFEYFLISYC